MIFKQRVTSNIYLWSENMRNLSSPQVLCTCIFSTFLQWLSEVAHVTDNVTLGSEINNNVLTLGVSLATQRRRQWVNLKLNTEKEQCVCRDTPNIKEYLLFMCVCVCDVNSQMSGTGSSTDYSSTIFILESYDYNYFQRKMQTDVDISFRSMYKSNYILYLV